jgi:hypothetical protein
VSFGGLDHPDPEIQQLLIVSVPKSAKLGRRSFLMTQDGRVSYRNDGAMFFWRDQGTPLGE